MIEEVSAGGVVFSENKILVLKKYNRIWVLPKGRREKDETIVEAALREVHEETLIDAKAIRYIGKKYYMFYDHIRKESVHKVVHWFLMQAKNIDCFPQKEEGFTKVAFIEKEKVLSMLKYENEKKIVQMAISEYEQK